MKYHRCGINNYSINIFKLLKKKKFDVTISDNKEKNQLINKLKVNKKDLKFFHFSNHPKDKLDQAKKIIITPGFIRTEKDYLYYKNNKKYISELDLFYDLSNWNKSKILFVTGSKGKTTLCKKIFNILHQGKKFKNVYYMDRKKYTFSNIPNQKKGSFLIAETDYQTLLIAKNIKAKYRISSSFSYTQNKAFKTKKLYLIAKKKILNNLKKNDVVILDHSSKESFKSINKSIVNIKKCDIKKKNNFIIKHLINLIEKKYNG